MFFSEQSEVYTASGAENFWGKPNACIKTVRISPASASRGCTKEASIKKALSMGGVLSQHILTVDSGGTFFSRTSSKQKTQPVAEVVQV